jgi:hypothetical protein
MRSRLTLERILCVPLNFSYFCTCFSNTGSHGSYVSYICKYFSEQSSPNVTNAASSTNFSGGSTSYSHGSTSSSGGITPVVVGSITISSGEYHH